MAEGLAFSHGSSTRRLSYFRGFLGVFAAWWFILKNKSHHQDTKVPRNAEFCACYVKGIRREDERVSDSGRCVMESPGLRLKLLSSPKPGFH
jgi:hypothetical protein